MKLYTEEQVRTMLDLAKLKKGNGNERYSKDDLLESLTPIELPSDEEIRAKGWEDAVEDDLAFYIGAKWMKEQILNQNK